MGKLTNGWVFLVWVWRSPYFMPHWTTGSELSKLGRCPLLGAWQLFQLAFICDKINGDLHGFTSGFPADVEPVLQVHLYHILKKYKGAPGWGCCSWFSDDPTEGTGTGQPQ